jgi:hypothetical protein
MPRKLTPKQKKAACWLATGAKGTEIAARFKMRPETLSRWKRIPEFRSEVERFMDQERAAMHYRLTHLSRAAVAAIWSELYDSGSDTKRIQVALNVLRIIGLDNIVVPQASEATPLQLPAPNLSAL